jgi:hypothetical protein
MRWDGIRTTTLPLDDAGSTRYPGCFEEWRSWRGLSKRFAGGGDEFGAISEAKATRGWELTEMILIDAIRPS